jgi:hypothetical protein
MTYPTDSKSSLLDCEQPDNAFIDAYLAVPVSFFPVLKGNCWRFFDDLNFFASPKSSKYRMFSLFPFPNTKFSGLMSL